MLSRFVAEMTENMYHTYLNEWDSHRNSLSFFFCVNDQTQLYNAGLRFVWDFLDIIIVCGDRVKAYTFQT